MPNLNGDVTRGEVAWKSALRTFIFAVLGAIYTQYTAKPDSTPQEYWKAAVAAFILALGKGVTAFFSAKDIRITPVQP